MTATDLAGLPLPVRLTEQRSIDERVHRKVFRFSTGPSATTGEQHSDFEDLDLMLGFAARATSSFPFAFEPVLLERPRGARAASASAAPGARAASSRRRPARAPSTTVAFADGGYLDNKPFSYATEALRSRRADVPVDAQAASTSSRTRSRSRATAPPTSAADERDRPDVIGNVHARR